MFDITTLPRHPLHHAVLESFLDLKSCPEPQQARFTSTLTRVLLDGIVTDQDLDQAPGFLTDPDVRILRLDLDLHGETTIDPLEASVSHALSDFRDEALMPGTKSPLVQRKGTLVFCEPLEDFTTLAQFAMEAGVAALAFSDPVYEDSMIVVEIGPQACHRWVAGRRFDRRGYRITA